MNSKRKKGKIRNELDNQNLNFYKKFSFSKKDIIDEIILKYDIEHSILEHFKNTLMFNKENINLEMDKFLLRRRLYLEKLFDEMINFEKSFDLKV